MNKRTLALFGTLFAFWLVISAEVNLQHLLTGLFLAGLMTWFWHDLSLRLPGSLHGRELIILGHCLLLLVGYVIQANYVVAKTLLSRKKPVDPVFVEMNTHIESNWVRVLLATCITLTPGTVTIDVDPDTGWFIVHALTKEIGTSLLYWRLIDRIRDLETNRQGG